MKRLLIIVSSILVLLIGVLFIAPGFVDWSNYKSQAQTQIKNITGLEASLNGRISLALLPYPQVLIEDVKLNAPSGSAHEHLIALERLEVNVALVPLLSGDIVVNSIELIKPNIALEILKNGQPNWITPEIKALLSKKGGASGQGPDLAGAVSLESVSIEDGSFQYKTSDNDEFFTLSDINLDITANSLNGPFEVGGQVKTLGNIVSFEAKAGVIKSGTSSVSLKANAKIEPAGLALSYAGIVGTAGVLDLQGETELKISSLSASLAAFGIKDVSLGKDAIVVKGFLTGAPEKLDYKNLTLGIAGHDLKGDLALELQPFSIEGSFQASEIFDVDALLGEPRKKEAGGAGLDGLLALVPATLNLPVPFEATIDLALPGLIYNKNVYSDVAFGIAKQDRGFKAAFSSLNIPGKGRLEVSADLSFAEKSLSEKTGGETYSGGMLNVAVTGKTQNMPYTVQALSGLDNIPLISGAKTGHFDFNILMSPSQLKLKDSIVRLDDSTFEISGSYDHTLKRPGLKIKVSADKIDMDALMSSGEKSEGVLDYKSAMKPLSLPFDVDLELGAQVLQIDGRDVKGAHMRSLLNAVSLTLLDVSADDYMGVSASLKGSIGDYKELSGIDLAFSGKTQNIRGLADVMKWDVSSLPTSLKAARLNAKLSGDVNVLSVSADVAALDGSFIANGKVKNPLGVMEIDGLAVQVKHKNMAKALRIFALDVPDYKSFSKPIDFYADVKQEESVLTLSNINAKLAGTSLSGGLIYDTSGSVALIKGDLNFGDLALVSARKKNEKAAQTSTQRSSQRSSQRWSRVGLDTGWMHSFNADLNVSANSILYDVWDLRKPELSFVLNDGKLNIDKLKAGLFDGQVAMTASLYAPASAKKPASLKARPSFTDVSLEPLVKALAGNAIIKGRGRVSMKADLSAIGLSQAALVGGMKGQGTITGSNIVLEGFDVARFAEALSGETKPGDSLLGLWQGVSKGGASAFDTLDGAFDVGQGVINITKLDLDGPQALLKTAGDVNLPKWWVTTAHTITVKERADIPPFTINISGSLDNPGQTFGQGALNDYFSRKINRKLEKLLIDKLGLPSGQKQQTPQGEGQQAPSHQQEVNSEDLFRGLLEGLIQ